jgi:hypothetical protein
LALEATKSVISASNQPSSTTSLTSSKVIEDVQDKDGPKKKSRPVHPMATAILENCKQNAENVKENEPCESASLAHSSKVSVTNQMNSAASSAPTKTASTAAPSSGRKPLATLPVSLRNQIQDKINYGLQKTKESQSSRWMKPKPASPAKQDMQSVLERRLKEMRFIHHFFLIKNLVDKI